MLIWPDVDLDGRHVCLHNVPEVLEITFKLSRLNSMVLSFIVRPALGESRSVAEIRIKIPAINPRLENE
jgi:hypothetical protein